MPGQILGTPHYMAPEQWGDHAVDARCDIFSMGATLYRLVTGVLPFPDRSPQEIARKAIEGIFDRPSHHAPDIPYDLELAILRMMAPNRGIRYASAQLCADDLQRVLNDEPVDVPRLMLISNGGPTERYPLLPGDSFVFGRGAESTFPVNGRSVSRKHAQITRGPIGFTIEDLGSSFGTFVGGQRISKVLLKNDDMIALGEVRFLFKDGGLDRARRALSRALAKEGIQIRSLPVPFVQVLAEQGDRRGVVGLLEDLAPDAQESVTESACTQIATCLGRKVADELREKLVRSLRRTRRRIPHYLFAITHENLGDEPRDWLAWWEEARSRLPSQIAPQRPTPKFRLRVVAGEPEPRTIPLDGDDKVFPVGRDVENGVTLHSLYVSRLHATIMRLHTRVVLRDQGSRFGTFVNGERVKICFLKPGDEILMGKVKLIFEAGEGLEPTSTSISTDETELDPSAWFLLAEAGDSTAALGLLSILAMVENPSWMHNEAAALYPDMPAKVESFYSAIRKVYERRAELAREVLPKILGVDPEGSLSSWQSAFRQKEQQLGQQLLPAGWFPVSTLSGRYRI
jgi:pSer/pThr/pTyr-binding forkhead associated (FHA) protein